MPPAPSVPPAPPPPRKRQQRAAPGPRDVAEIARAIEDMPLESNGLVLLKKYVALRWSSTVAKGQMASKAEELRVNWGWEADQIVRTPGQRGGLDGYYVDRDALLAAHIAEFSLGSAASSHAGEEFSQVP